MLFKENNLHFTPMLKACHDNSLKAMKCLLKYGQNVNYVASVGMTPLMQACKAFSLDIVDHLPSIL